MTYQDFLAAKLARVHETGVTVTEHHPMLARAVLDADPTGLRLELVQVAAVAVAWLESL